MADHTVAGLNEAPSSEFTAALGGIFEHAPWIAAAAAGRRPFASLAELFATMREVVRDSSEDRKLALLHGHPELAGAAARAGTMTSESASEQGGAGLDRIPAADAALFDEMNAAYRSLFGFPFIVCVRRHGYGSLVAEFRRRLAQPAEAERQNALDEVFRIAALRLAAAVRGPDELAVHGRLSTHVLDTARGRPAAGVRVELVELTTSGERAVASAVTNAGGRTDDPLIGGRPVPRATYELRFHLGAYYAGTGTPLADPPFLDVVPIRFGVAEPEAHYHVPLAATPWSYQTYRGS